VPRPATVKFTTLPLKMQCYVNILLSVLLSLMAYTTD